MHPAVTPRYEILKIIPSSCSLKYLIILLGNKKYTSSFYGQILLRVADANAFQNKLLLVRRTRMCLEDNLDRV